MRQVPCSNAPVFVYSCSERGVCTPAVVRSNSQQMNETLAQRPLASNTRLPDYRHTPTQAFPAAATVVFEKEESTNPSASAKAAVQQ
jgi:hypothetical protein